MTRLEELLPNVALRGILPDDLVNVVSVQWFGSEALELTYKTATGSVANELLYRHDESRLEIAAAGHPWSFDGDGALFRLVAEAQRIRLAHLFDPVVHHLIRVLASGGEGAAAVLLSKLGSKAEVARELCYRLYTLCERKKRAADALAYNGLVQSWPEIARPSAELPGFL